MNSPLNPEHTFYFIIFVIVSSLGSNFLYGLFNYQKFLVFGVQKKLSKLVIFFALLFPMHFTLLETFYLQLLENKLLFNIANKMSPRSYMKLNRIKSRLKQINTIYVRLHLIESFIERIPQLVVQICLIAVTFSYQPGVANVVLRHDLYQFRSSEWSVSLFFPFNFIFILWSC